MSSNSGMVVVGVIVVVIFIAFGTGAIPSESLNIRQVQVNNTITETVELKSPFGSMFDQIEVINQKLHFDLAMYMIILLILVVGLIIVRSFVSNISDMEDNLDSLEVSNRDLHKIEKEMSVLNRLDQTQKARIENAIRSKKYRDITRRNKKENRAQEIYGFDPSKYIESPIANEEVFDESTSSRTCSECGLTVMQNWKKCYACGNELR